MLYKSSQFADERVIRLVVPRHMRDEVLSITHEELGHLGRDKTLSVAQERYFWVGLAASVENKVRFCPRCICSKSPHLPERAPLVNIVTSRPLELLCIDFLSLERSKGGYMNILVATDHFTKYALAYPTRNQEAKTVARILVEHFIPHYGIPERIHSDQGGSFEGKVIHHLCKVLGVKKSRTTPYHPQGDGTTERYNRTLLSMLRSLNEEKKLEWKEHLAMLVHAYNATRHESTGYSPFFLMFGRRPRLAVDVFLGLPGSEDLGREVRSVQDTLSSAYKLASEAAKRAARKQKSGYDRKIRGSSLAVGDYVLVKNVGLKGKHKLADKWVSERYVVVDQPNPDIPVYKVRQDGGSKVKMLHRNMLLPLQLPYEFPAPASKSRAECTVRVPAESQGESDGCVETDDDLFVDVVLPEQVVNADICTNSDCEESWHPLSPQSPQFVGGEGLEMDTEECEGSVGSQDSQRLVVQEQELLEEQVQVEQGDADSESGSDVVEEPLPRRSGRERREPERFGDYVRHNQVRVRIQNWREKVGLLLQLSNAFPLQRGEIGSAIIYIVAHGEG